MMGSNDMTREQHALREQNFFASTNTALDDYIARVSAYLEPSYLGSILTFYRAKLCWAILAARGIC